MDLNWIAWAEQQVRIIKDGGHLIFPSDGVILQINKGTKTLDLIACRPTWIGCETEATNRRVFSNIGYQYVRPDDVPTTLDAIIDKIFANLQKYAADMPTLLHAIGVVFGLKSENESSDDELLGIIASKGKKLPINPVTIRGDGNFTVGRLWIGNDSVPDTSHRFNPAVQRGPKWDKPITILLWKEGQSLSVEDPNRPAMIVDEADFIDFIKNIKDSLSSYVKLWGQADRVNEEQKMFALFDKVEEGDRLTVKLYKTNADYSENTLVGEAVLVFAKFIDGLEHLFPNGELS